LFTEIVENPVEKDRQTRTALQQSEEISGLHYRWCDHRRVQTPMTKAAGLY